MYKTELHCHSAEVSACAKATAGDLARRYTEAGYSTVVLTNHFASFTYDHLKCTNWQDWIDKYLRGVEALCKASQGTLSVLLGAEVRFEGDPNDYLLYGVTEEFLRKNAFLFRMSVDKFYPAATRDGILVVQAHPFRDHMRITPPGYLDGIEVYNGSAGGHYGTDSRNDAAALWGEKFKKIKTSGTDLHYPDDRITGGILTAEKITENASLVTTLVRGNYERIEETEEK